MLNLSEPIPQLEGDSVAARDVMSSRRNVSNTARESLRKSIRSKRVTVNDQRPDEMVISFSNLGYAVDIVTGRFRHKKVEVKHLLKNITGTIMVQLDHPFT